MQQQCEAQHNSELMDLDAERYMDSKIIQSIREIRSGLRVVSVMTICVFLNANLNPSFSHLPLNFRVIAPVAMLTITTSFWHILGRYPAFINFYPTAITVVGTIITTEKYISKSPDVLLIPES